MDERDIRKLLEQLRAGRLTTDQVLDRLRRLPFEDLGFAKIDHHRALRLGYSEVIFGRGKTPQQVAQIVRGMLRVKGSQQNILITRADRRIYAAVRRVSRAALASPASPPSSTASDLACYPESRCLSSGRKFSLPPHLLGPQQYLHRAPALRVAHRRGGLAQREHATDQRPGIHLSAA